jgi:hypothetical protein
MRVKKQSLVERMHLDVKRRIWGAIEADGRCLESEAYAWQAGELLARVHHQEWLERTAWHRDRADWALHGYPRADHHRFFFS